MLEGERTKAVNQVNFRITIRLNSNPTFSYTVNSQNKMLFSPDYEFTFASHAQAKEYLHMEPGKDGQIYAKAEATASSCFISTVGKIKRDDTSPYLWLWIVVVCIIGIAAIYTNWIRTPKPKG
jgi:hypothetical protein